MLEQSASVAGDLTRVADLLTQISKNMPVPTHGQRMESIGRVVQNVAARTTTKVNAAVEALAKFEEFLAQDHPEEDSEEEDYDGRVVAPVFGFL